MKHCASTLVLSVLVASSLWKVIGTTSASPLIAYANNWDFIRVESCIGVWQDYVGKPKTSGFVQRPVNRLVFDGDKRQAFCVKSVDILFPLAVSLCHQQRDTIDFRQIGWLRIAFLLACFAWLLHLVAGDLSRIVVAMAFLLTFGDIAYLSYVNTLYVEFSVVFGILFSVLAIAMLWFGDRPRATAVAFTVLVLVWLGLSKEQYVPLAIILCCVVAWLAARKFNAGHLAVLLLTAAALIPVAFYWMNADSDRPLLKDINLANKTDTFLGAVLPNLTDQRAGLRMLGLPEHCDAAIGKTWYSPDLQDHHPCPEIRDASRLRLLGVLLVEPRAFFRLLHLAVLGSRPLYLNNVGRVEDEDVRNTVIYRVTQLTSISGILDALPQRLYASIIYLSMLAGLCAAASLVIKANRAAEKTRWLSLLALGGFSVLYSLVSSVFGDGFIEIPKHAVGLGIGLACQCTAVIGWIVHCVVGKKHDAWGRAANAF